MLTVLAFVAAAWVALPWVSTQLFKNTLRMGSQDLELKDFIAKVKADLEAADRAEVEAGRAPLFALQDVELEANFTVQSRAGADIKLVTVSGSTLAGIERSQKIVLHLKPVPRQAVTVGASTAPLVTPPCADPIVDLNSK